MNLSGFFSLNTKDVVKAAALVVITTLLAAIQQAVTAHGFAFADYNWPAILQLAGTAGASYLIKNLLSTSDGKVFGKIG
jgi:uncharacterized integral membrane protein